MKLGIYFFDKTGKQDIPTALAELEVLSAILDKLATRMTEQEFVNFCEKLEQA